MESTLNREWIYGRLEYYEGNLRMLYKDTFGDLEDFKKLQDEVNHDLELAGQFPDDKKLRDLAERVSEQIRKLDATSIEELLDL